MIINTKHLECLARKSFGRFSELWKVGKKCQLTAFLAFNKTVQFNGSPFFTLDRLI
jgi:hypothetical protein